MKDKTVIVTGAGSGIRRGITIGFAKAGSFLQESLSPLSCRALGLHGTAPPGYRSRLGMAKSFISIGAQPIMAGGRDIPERKP